MAKKTSNTAERIKLQQTKLLEHLAESGNISFACKRAGISRETYYRWCDDEEFEQQANKSRTSGKEFVNDLAHSQLIRNIQDGDMSAIKFQLSNCHDDYHPKKSTSPYWVEEQTPPITALSISTMVEIERYREFLKREGDGNERKP